MGRYPIEYYAPKSEEELRERKLHRMIKYHSKKLSKETIAELEALRAPLDAEILTSVRALGRYPIEYNDPKCEEEFRERKLHCIQKQY